MAAMISSNSNPTLLASTTNCSTSCCKIRFLSPARACGGSATTVPMPGLDSSHPSWIRYCTTLCAVFGWIFNSRSEEHTSELQSRLHLVCRLLLEKKKNLICDQQYRITIKYILSDL